MPRYALMLTLVVALLVTGCGKSSPTPTQGSTPPPTPPPVAPPVSTPATGAPNPSQPPALNAGDTVKVGLPSVDCLNLRGGHSTAATVIACVAGGSKLTVTTPAQPPHLNWGDGDWWVHVRTDKGQEGWVAVSAGQVKRLETPTSASDLLKGEADTMAHWLKVASGWDPCSDPSAPNGCIADTHFGHVVTGLVSRCDKVSPGDYRTVPGYDATRDGPLVTAFENACNLLRTALKDLPTPTEKPTPAWQAKIAEANAALAKRQ